MPFSDNVYRSAFCAAGRAGSCRVEETIVISGSPRSGTTLMIEALQALPGYKAVNEPLLRQETRDRHGFQFRTYLEPGQHAPVQRAFLERTLTGRLGPDHRWSFRSRRRWARLLEHATHRRLIVKFCRLNRMLHWFVGEFQPRGLIVVIRHPCSVISSMLKFGQWDKSVEAVRAMKGSYADLAGLPEPVQDRFRPIVERVRTRVEQLATMWCLDYYIPLRHFPEHPWILAPYERLVTEGVTEFRRITAALGVTPTDEMLRILQKPSSSVKGHLPASPLVQLGKWKLHLKPEEIDSILRIVEAAGLGDLYGADPEPAYQALNALQAPMYRWTESCPAAAAR